MNTNLVIIPARSRPEKARIAFELLKENSLISDFMIGLDEDDAHNYPEFEGVIREVNPRLKMNGTLNLLSDKYKDQYKTITFMGDDHHVRTHGWDKVLYEPIEKRGYGYSYGNDLLAGKRLPTMVMASTNIVKILGFFSPKELIHLYMDNFWKTMGENLNAIDYFEDVIIEHMHFSAGKSELDAQYDEVNAEPVFSHDSGIFWEYEQKYLKDDVEKILKGLNI